MKGFAVSFLASAALLTVCAGRFADDKENAIMEIDSKFNEIIRTSKIIFDAAETEKKNTNTKGESELLGILDVKTNDTRIQLEKDAKMTLKTAITKAKPVSVIHCIRNVTFSGFRQIDVKYDQHWEMVVLIRLNKIEKIDFDIYAVRSIVDGLKDLIDQAKKEIREGGLILAIKTQAFNNCRSADLLLGEIEVLLHEPILSKEYVKLRQEIDRNLTKLRLDFNGELEKCLGK